MKPYSRYLIIAILSLFHTHLSAQPGLNVQNRINSKVQTRAQGKVVSKTTSKVALKVSTAAAKKASEEATKGAAKATDKAGFEIENATKKKPANKKSTRKQDPDDN